MNNQVKIWISGISYPYDGWTLTGIWSTRDLAAQCATTPISGHSWIQDEEDQNRWNATADYNTDCESDMVAFIQEWSLDQVGAAHQVQMDNEPNYRKWLFEHYGEKNKDNGEN
jgi:hypothetical protein